MANHEQILEEEEVEKTRGWGIVFWSLHTQTVGSMKEWWKNPGGFLGRVE